jgi:malate dehydrogenase
MLDDTRFGVPDHVVFSFPVRCMGQEHYEIAQDVALSPIVAKEIKITTDELLAERAEAFARLNETTMKHP